MTFNETQNEIQFSLNPYHFSRRSLISLEQRICSALSKINVTVKDVERIKLNVEVGFKVSLSKTPVNPTEASSIIEDLLATMRTSRI
ncbi:hypothetical protein LMH73_010640 [Vibrio splendidus]|nr:hypothetical protein [Vibrio splendidus]MCC4880404.1 hypothetical protein [Vibrio splendidus]